MRAQRSIGRGVLRAASAFACMAALACMPAFAEDPESRLHGCLSSFDIDALIKNREILAEELPPACENDENVSFDANPYPDTDSLSWLYTIEGSPKLDAVFKKYGMGKDGFLKFCVIRDAFELVAYERVNYDEADSADDEDLAAMRACFNSDDLALVALRWDDLTAVFGDPTASADDESDGEYYDTGSDDQSGDQSDGEYYDDEYYGDGEGESEM